MSTMSFTMSVSNGLSTPSKVIAIAKTKQYDLTLTLENGKCITIDERLIMSKDLIPTEDMYIVRITRDVA